MSSHKLTKSYIQSIEATDKQYEIRDTLLCGFAVRIGVSGKKSFVCVYRAGKGRGAQQRRVTLGVFPNMTVEQARDLARAKLAEVAQGGDPAVEIRAEKAELSVAEVLSRFVAEHFVEGKLKPKTISEYRRQIDNYILPELGKLKITKVQPRNLSKLHHALRESPYQANRVLALLSKFFNWCEVTGFRDRSSNPTFGIERFKEHAKKNFMGQHEVEAIGSSMRRLEVDKAISPAAVAVLKVLLLTGARKSEIASLKWEYIDFEKGVANLPDSKTGEKPVQLSAAALGILSALPRVSEFCFPAASASGHIENLTKPWHKILEHAGLSGWRIHDLRHAFASYAVNSGETLPIIGKILGHTQAATTARYAHVADNPVKEAVEETARKLNKDLSGGKVLPFTAAI